MTHFFVGLSRDGAILSLAAAEAGFLIVYTAVVLLLPSHASIRRFMGLLALAVLTWISQAVFSQLCSNPQWRATGVPLLWIQLMSASEIILISKVQSSDFLDAEPVGQRGTGMKTTHASLARAKRAVGLVWNLRRVQTRWQVKKMPTSPACSRTRFVVTRTVTTGLAYLVLDALVSGPPMDLALVSDSKATLYDLTKLSAGDLVFRTVGTIAFWISLWLVNLVMSNSVAVASVVLHLSAPSDCPPLYGPVLEAYSIRKFWGNSWHQCLRRGLTGHADRIVDCVLPAPRSTSLSRYSRLALAFLISGFIHRTSDMAMGVSGVETGSLAFFLLQPLGIILEDAIFAVGSQRLGTLPKWLRRVVGYLWVVLFLAWSTPVWFYPQARLALDSSKLLPFHVVRLVA